MRILVIGSGGREHALVWSIAQSKLADKIFCAPGNGGITRLAESIDIKAEDIARLLEFARKEKIDLTVVGPEAPLAQGIVDQFLKSKSISNLFLTCLTVLFLLQSVFLLLKRMLSGHHFLQKRDQIR